MIPGMRGTDHIGITVPDLDEAEHFFVQILGAVPVYTLPPKRADDDWMSVHLGVHPRTVVREIRFYRLGNGSNIELFEYASADGQAPQPRNSDIGGHHLALYVDDMDAALEYLRGHDVEIMGDPVASAGASAGQRWVYFRSPWGMQFELVSYPAGKAYETDAETLLWHPARPAE
jgi:catechol 2,3-dioxygenase-like lactoylglutathione lyase family enzyme